MANLTSVTDIIEYVLWKSGENPSDTSGDYYNKALEYVNQVRLDLFRGNSPLKTQSNINFKWAVSYPPSSLVLQPKITTGTVAVVQDSTTITFSSAPAASVAGYYFKVDEKNDWYRVSAHTGGVTTATIDCAYTEATNATATYKLIKTEYTTGATDIIRIISPLRIFRQHNVQRADARIYGIDSDKFDLIYPLRDIEAGIPEAFKIVKVSANAWTIVFSRYSDEDKIKVEYNYIALPSDLTLLSADADIIVPREYRFVIADAALGLVLEDKSDDRMNSALKRAQAGFELMVNDYRYTQSGVDPTFAQLVPREDDEESGDNPLRTESGLIIG